MGPAISALPEINEIRSRHRSSWKACTTYNVRTGESTGFWFCRECASGVVALVHHADREGIPSNAHP